MTQITLSNEAQRKQTTTTVVIKLSPIQKPFVTLGIIASILLCIAIVSTTDWVQGILYIIGIALGMTLYYTHALDLHLHSGA